MQQKVNPTEQEKQREKKYDLSRDYPRLLDEISRTLEENADIVIKGKGKGEIAVLKMSPKRIM